MGSGRGEEEYDRFFGESLMKRKVTFSEKPPSETYIIEEVFFTDVKYPEEQKHYKCVSKVFVIQKEFPFLICYSNINYTPTHLSLCLFPSKLTKT